MKDVEPVIFNLSHHGGLIDPAIPGNSAECGKGTLQIFRDNNICGIHMKRIFQNFCHNNIIMVSACATAIHENLVPARKIIDGSFDPQRFSPNVVMQMVKKNHPDYGDAYKNAFRLQS